MKRSDLYGKQPAVAAAPTSYGTATTGFAETEPFVEAFNAANVEVADEGPVYRDVPFAIAFVLHLGVMIFLGVRYGSFGADEINKNIQEAEASGENVQVNLDEIELYSGRIVSYMVLPCAVASFIIAYVTTAFVIPSCPNAMVTSSLLGSFGWALLTAIMLVTSAPAWYTYLSAAFILAVTAYYIKIVWRLIPFAGANLGMSLKGISANWGMYLVALLFSAVGFVWTIFWFYVTIGVMNSEGNALQEKSQQVEYYDKDDDPRMGFTMFFLLLSLYWTHTVMMNTVQVTVAGVMGTWCFNKDEASGCCSPAVYNSLYRSVTYSFGSICFGSLFQALITALRVMLENARNAENDNCQLLLCILECIVRCLEDIIEYFNQWAYVFVGIYGFSYLESGRKVIELFRARGWTTIITNDLVGWVLNFTTFTVGILTGLIAMVINASLNGPDGTTFLFGSMPGSGYWAFGIGLITGIVVCSAMMNAIKGAVNTLIVCFADAPAVLENNHPEATRKLADSWISVFPDCGIPSPTAVVV